MDPRYDRKLTEMQFPDKFKITLPTKEEFLERARKLYAESANPSALNTMYNYESHSELYDALMKNPFTFVYQESARRYQTKFPYYNEDTLLRFFKLNFAMAEINDRTFLVVRKNDENPD